PRTKTHGIAASPRSRPSATWACPGPETTPGPPGSGLLCWCVVSGRTGVEDGVSAYPTPDHVRFTREALLPVLPRGPTIGRPGHLIDSRGTLNTLDPQAGSEFSFLHVGGELARHHAAKVRGLLLGQLLEVRFEAGSGGERGQLLFSAPVQERRTSTPRPRNPRCRRRRSAHWPRVRPVATVDPRTRPDRRGPQSCHAAEPGRPRRSRTRPRRLHGCVAPR